MPKPATKTQPKVEEPAADDQPQDTPKEDDGLVRFEFRGVTFTVPRDGNEWDVNAWISLLRGQWYQVVEYQFRATNQWDILRALGSKRKDINEFLAVFSGTVRKEVDFS